MRGLSNSPTPVTLGAKGGFGRGNEGVIHGQLTDVGDFRAKALGGLVRLEVARGKEGVSNPPTLVTLGGEMRVFYLANSPTSVTFRGGFGRKNKGG